jgi:hypothetical protein
MGNRFRHSQSNLFTRTSDDNNNNTEKRIECTYKEFPDLAKFMRENFSGCVRVCAHP